MRHARADTLNDIMEFDHVIEVHDDGSITHPGSLAPTLYEDENFESGYDLSPGWELLNGFSRQDRYSGPIMHRSEYIGGGMESYIRETPGTYVALVAETLDDSEPDGWAVAVKEEA